jgi:hypothetical protein
VRFAITTLLSVVALGGIPSWVEAQDDARITAAARSLFQEGVACSDHQDWPCAVDRFSSARALRSSPVILLNYAIALSHVGRIVEASEIYRALGRDTSAPAALRAEATQAVTELEPRFGRLRARVTGSLDGVGLTLDGAEVAVSIVGVAVPGDPGDHVLEAHRAGAVVASARVHVESGATAEATLTIPDAPRVDLSPAVVASGAEANGTMPEPAPAEHHEVFEEAWFWTVLAVVVIGAGVGIGVGVATSSPTTVLPSGTLGTIDARP